MISWTKSEFYIVSFVFLFILFVCVGLLFSTGTEPGPLVMPRKCPLTGLDLQPSWLCTLRQDLTKFPSLVLNSFFAQSGLDSGILWTQSPEEDFTFFIFMILIFVYVICFSWFSLVHKSPSFSCPSFPLMYFPSDASSILPLPGISHKFCCLCHSLSGLLIPYHGPCSNFLDFIQVPLCLLN